jgi:hypothetical protein
LVLFDFLENKTIKAKTRFMATTTEKVVKAKTDIEI